FGHLNPAAVQSCALASFSGEHFVAQWVIDDTDLQLALMFEPDRHTEARIAVRVVCGAIQWIYDPAPFRLRARRGSSRPRFFRKNVMPRIVGLDAIDDQTFRR